MNEHLQPQTADAALADSIGIVERLHATCCEPGRSPRMERLQETLSLLRSALADGGPVDEAKSLLADAGAQVGWLEVACCAEKRLPLYTEILSNLAATHRALDAHQH